MTSPQFLTEVAPPRGVATAIAPGVRRLVAENAGPMTYHGTNTYLLDAAEGVTVLDPGPDDAGHVAAILSEAGAPVVRILLTHGHADHVGAAAALAAASHAPVFRWLEHGGGGLANGSLIAGLRVLHTPGHAPDHVCFVRDDGVVFSGDHVMSFATSVIIPPDGDMAAYMAGLRRMLAYSDSVFLPGHGPPIDAPGPFVASLLRHREERESAVLAAVRQGGSTATAVVDVVYPGLNPRLRGAAEATVTAHLRKLATEARAMERHGEWRAM